MEATRPTIYVCKYGEKYVRFESYSGIQLVDFPEQATPYRRKQDALGKVRKSWGSYWWNSKEIKATALIAVSISYASHTEQRVK